MKTPSTSPISAKLGLPVSAEPALPTPFALRLFNQMVRQGYTVAELAARTGMDRQRLHAILKGADPRFSAVLALCRALGVSLAIFDGCYKETP